MTVIDTSVTRVASDALTLSSPNSPDAWDRVIEQLGGHLLQSWRWGEFKSAHGWKPLRLLLEESGQPMAAAQILLRSVGPLRAAYVPRGPLVAPGRPDVMAHLTVAIDRAVRSRRGALCLIEPEQPDLVENGGGLSWARTEALIQPRRTIKVRIDASDDELLARMKPKTRYNIRLAQRRGVTVRPASLDDLPAFYSLLQETASRDEFGIHELGYFRDMLQVFGADADLLLAEYEGRLAAGVLILCSFGEAIYMFGASSTELQRHMPAYLIQFEAMRRAREHGCHLYDLWGIPPEDEPPAGETQDGQNLNVRDGMWGVYRFKQGFGGEIVAYPGIYERVYLKPLVSLARRFGLGAL